MVAYMKIFQKLVWVVMGVYVAIIIFAICTFQVDDMTLSKGNIYEYNTNWIMFREDGTSAEIDSLPFSGESKPGEIVIIENIIPEEYKGLTLSFLSADKTLKVYLDGEIIYEFGTKDKRAFGHTPGSVYNFIDIPDEFKEGRIRIEMMSSYDNFAASIGEMEFAKRDIAILNLIKRNLTRIICNVIILFAGVVMAFLAVIQIRSHQSSNGMEYLSLFCIASSIYYFIETKALHIFYGNQTLYSILIFLILMILPMFIVLYYQQNLPDKYKKYFDFFLIPVYSNIAVQLILQLFNVVDFMNMAFLSHALLLLTVVLGIIIFSDILYNERGRGNLFEFIALCCMMAGGIIDVGRTYFIKVGDFGKYSRFGVTLYCSIMVAVHIMRISRKYAASIEENAMLLQREVENMEEQNKRLQLAKEEAESARREAQLANEAKSGFLANMSHEIRTPINAVLGMDAMILRENTQANIQEYALDIQSAGQGLLSLVNDILDFSKIESGKMEITPVEYELYSLINDSYNMVAMRAKEKNLKLHIQNDTSMPEKLYGDEVRIRQIIVNLLTNAVKYTKEGAVIVWFGWERIDEEQMLLKISVQDTGIGIRKEDMGRLFDSFERMDEGKNRNIEGTGLGLAITKCLVDFMKGNITVESEYGKGSVFCVELPQKIISAKPLGNFSEKYMGCVNMQQTYRESFQAPKARILVVDDVAMNLKVMVGLLKNTKMQIDTVENGMECLEMVREREYHIIFLDHMMPQMDGIEVLHRMQQMPDNKNKNTPKIMLTANAIMGAKEEYLQMGFQDYLSKPIREIKLEEMILKYLPEELVIKQEVKENQEQPTENFADVSDDTPIMERLSFLDTAKGLAYCGESEELYMQIIRSYLNNTRYQEMESYYRAEDWDNYRIQAHALKSTSLTIGAVELSNMAKKLELAAREEDSAFLKAHHKELMDKYMELLQKLEFIKMLKMLKN